MPFVAFMCTGLLVAGCASQAGPADTPASGARADIPRASGPTTLKIGLIVSAEPKAGIALFSETGTGPPEFTYTYHAGLTILDGQGNLTPQLAERVPTTDNGDWKLLPDGQMEVTWRLRPDVRWHDGTPLTAADFVFGLQLMQDDQLPTRPVPGIRLIGQAMAVDDHTLVLTWKQPYILANASNAMDLTAVPQHLLAERYQGDKQAFANHPYWAREFVGLGPYRLGDWVEGSHVEALAFDQYALGRPRIDRLVFQFSGDVNALTASVLAGTVDLVPMGALRLSELLTIKQAWDPTGSGTTYTVFSGTRSGRIQYRDPSAPWASDVRVRQALIHALDRQSITDSLQFGMTSPADTLVAPGDPVYQLLEHRGLARYPYDPARAEQLLRASGWTRGADGTYRSAAGEPFTIEVRSLDRVDSAQEGQAVASLWKREGLDANPYAFPDNAANRFELRSVFPGIMLMPIQYADNGLAHLTTAQVSAPANRWSGSNQGGYSNPAFDTLSERYLSTLDRSMRHGLLADLLKMEADQALTIHLYYAVGTQTTAFRNIVRGPTPGPSTQLVTAWNINTWEMLP
jgi:peptide/nickel transport system substrate-binding protein